MVLSIERMIEMLGERDLGVVNRTNSEFQLSELFGDPTLRFLELAKGVQIIEVGLYRE